MLGLMRRHSRSIIIKLVYVGLILSFLVWGVGSYNSRKDLVAVSVDGEKITYTEYQKSFENLVSYYKETLKEGFNDELIIRLNLKKQALDSLVDRILLIEEAKRVKLRADKDDVQERIRSYPAFQKNGRFDKETYLRVLSYNRIKPGDFERQQKELILKEKVQDIIKKGVSLSDDEILADYSREKATVNLEFIKVSPDVFVNKVKITGDEMQDYFSSHMGEFTIPAKIRVGYALFDPNSFLGEVRLTREDYEDYYKSYIDDFTIPRRVRARHILVKSVDDREKARAKAEDLLSKVEKGEDFSGLAKKYSDDPGSAKKGGDLGFFGKGEMVQTFEEAAFSMEKGEVSGLVETVYGFHLIKVADIDEERVKPLEEVKPEIKRILEAEISRELAETRAEDIYYEALKGRNLEELLKEEKLSYKITNLFPLDNIPPPLENLRPAIQSVSSMEAGWVGRPVEAGDKFYILTLLGKEEPREPGFDEVKGEVEGAVTEEKAVKAAAELAEKVLAGAKKVASLGKAAKEHKLKVEETGHFSRSTNLVPNIGVSQEIVGAAFELVSDRPLPDMAYMVGSDAVIFALKERREIKQEDFEREKEMFGKKLLGQKGEEAYKKWLEEARRNARIVYHEDLQSLEI